MLEDKKQKLAEELSELKDDVNDPSFALGFLTAILFVSIAFTGVNYWNSLDHRKDVTVTVVTCDSCSYEKFRNATDRMFDAQYREVDYSSEKGRRLVEKYNLYYVPGFIFSSEIEKAEAFNRVKPTLVKMDGEYVIPDRDPKVAQRLSSGVSLNVTH